MLAIRWALISTLALAATASLAADRRDIVVYSDRVPATTKAGNPFPETPISCERGTDSQSCDSAYPTTAIDFEVVDGLRHPIGTSGWGLASYGKYVLMGNYEQGLQGLSFSGAPIVVADQQIGLFDSERKTFCVIDIDASVDAVAVVQTIEVAQPEARQSRIYFQGFVTEPLQGVWFGFIEADLDNPSPCDPVTGWQVTGFDGLEIFQAYPTGTVCPFTNCGFDGFEILDVNTTTGVDTVVFNDWWGSQLIVGQVDALGNLTIPYVLDIPVWQPGGVGTACAILRPVNQPKVDRTRGPADVRFTVHFDRSDGPADPGCGPYTDPGKPMREYSWSGGVLTPVSPYFYAQSASGAYPWNIGLLYDDFGGLWAADYTPAGKNVSIYAVNSSGEHSYYDPASTSSLLIDPPQQSLAHTPHGTFEFPKEGLQHQNHVYWTGKARIERAVRFFGAWFPQTEWRQYLGTDILPREPRHCFDGLRDGQGCHEDADCPSSTCVAARVCDGGANDNTPCDTFADCPGGLCIAAPVPTWFQGDLVEGGSPSSLWATTIHSDKSRSVAANAYLTRLPISDYVPDSLSAVRPGVAWTESAGCVDCERMWMFADRGAGILYRVRDDGLWSGWYPLGAAGATTGGISAVFDDGELKLYARSSFSKVSETKLTSALDCAPGSCTWQPWSELPGSPVAANEPAAAVANFGDGATYVAARDAANNQVWVGRNHAGGTWSWQLLPSSRLTDVAPSLAPNPNDASGRMWVAIRNTSDGEISLARVDDQLASTAWEDLPARPQAPTPWAAGPTVLWDGEQARVFASEGSFPQFVQQLVHDGTGWDSWARISSEGVATRQSVGAVVHGDVNLFTYWYTLGLAEQLVP